MKTTTVAALGWTGLAIAGGTGKYSASWTTDPSLPDHVLYAPTNPPAGLKLPVIAWGEGACSFNGLDFQKFLIEVASYGVFIIANGSPTGGENVNGMAETSYPNATAHRVAIDWVTKVAGTTGGKYANVDASRLAAAGMSCGGIQSYAIGWDPRVTAIGIFNSGIKNLTDVDWPKNITKPIFYFLGGPTDIAYENGERDYTVLPATTPKWKGNLPVGHGGTYNQTNGGKFGVAAVHWARWLLRGDKSAATWFTGNGTGTARGDGWSVAYQSLDLMKIDKIDNVDA
ncbi:hypothetical protein QBC47DRAFT_404387 [Echria macrotheca]|uniref:Uncharacterized protein n=1 Tax=Echria macrotheca TaxID=438768 RepID=A0AAJ0B876_9PEZI|nr:hypothetical protein QBC47DRAFT_404387 [Echria macrotheca]